MSQENVAIVRHGYEALNSGDVEAALALFDPDVEVHLAQDAGNVIGLDFEPVYRGVEGFLRFLGRLSEAFGEFRWEPEEYFDAGDDVVVFVRMITTGRRSGTKTEHPLGHLCTMRDGKLVRHETFWERSTALEAAGLSEPAPQGGENPEPRA
jgi:ketosteroid isomerase-like protein